MRWFVVTADYRAQNENKPKYAFCTGGDVRYVMNWFKRAYPWLTVYDIVETTEAELPEGLKMWVSRI